MLRLEMVLSVMNVLKKLLRIMHASNQLPALSFDRIG